MLIQLARAQEELVIAIQPTLSSDQMLKTAKPLEQFIKDGLGGKPDVQIVAELNLN
jgi:ABC-type phosphate/phosphonate transport system substrate-binding protein